MTEYSTDRIEMHVGALQPGQRVVLVDDLIATGGTLRKLHAAVSAQVCTCCVHWLCPLGHQERQSAAMACGQPRRLGRPLLPCMHFGTGRLRSRWCVNCFGCHLHSFPCCCCMLLHLLHCPGCWPVKLHALLPTLSLEAAACLNHMLFLPDLTFIQCACVPPTSFPLQALALSW